jgi:hypothetical protein
MSTYPPTTLTPNLATAAWKFYMAFLVLGILGFVLLAVVSVVMYAREACVRVARMEDLDGEMRRVEQWRDGARRPREARV